MLKARQTTLAIPISYLLEDFLSVGLSLTVATRYYRFPKTRTRQLPTTYA